MGQIGISITKQIAFRGAIQEFANTYHYGSLLPNPNASEAQNLINELVTTEKLIHSTNVSFTLGRCWSSGGTIAQNQMIEEMALSGAGSTAAGTAIDPERAILIQWPAGLDTRGRKVYLRKWYHCYGNAPGVTITNAMLTQQTAFSSAQRTTIRDIVDAVTRLGSSNEWGLIAESGRERDGGLLASDPPECHPWFEHHQLGDAWRG